jgi:hypothetical protein
VSENAWGLSNFSDFNAYVVAHGQLNNYWRVIPAHGRKRYIANEPITAIYAEREPD